MPQTQLKGDALKREMERRSNDELLVYNPTEADFKFKYASRWWLVPAVSKDAGYGKGQMVFLRYIATQGYMSKMTDYLITQESDKIVAERKKVYNGNDWPGEEMRVALRTNNIELRKKYLQILFKGVYRRFGMDELAAPPEPETAASTHRPVDYDILDQIEDSMDTETPAEPVLSSAVEPDFISQITQ